MKKKILMMLFGLSAVLLFIAGCSGQESTSTRSVKTAQVTTPQPVRAAWVTPEIASETVTVPLDSIEDNQIIHFMVPGPDGDIAFMGYDLDGAIHIRANVCPPCRSVGFSLFGDTLVCDTCRTTFEAATGDGISGGCVAYPKAKVTYSVDGEYVSMKSEDLITAYLNTLEPGRP